MSLWPTALPASARVAGRGPYDGRVRAPRSPHTLRAAFRRQTVLALALSALALMRALLPVRAVGALAVRSRGLDVAVLLALALGIAVLSTSPNL